MRKGKQKKQMWGKNFCLFYSKLNWGDEDQERINSLQSKLDEMYLSEAKGAYIGSRAKLIEEGEKNRPVLVI